MCVFVNSRAASCVGKNTQREKISLLWGGGGGGGGFPFWRGLGVFGRGREAAGVGF